MGTMQWAMSSDGWDHEKSILDLVQDVDRVYVDTHYRHSDTGYGGIVVYIPHKHDDGYTIVTTDQYGACYEGDIHFANGVIEEDPNIHTVPVDTGLSLLEKWRNLQIAREELANLLVSSPIDQDCVNIVITNSYTLENSHK